MTGTYGGGRGTYENLVKKPERERGGGREREKRERETTVTTSRSWIDNVKMNLQET
jgi:hypothetical protein